MHQTVQYKAGHNDIISSFCRFFDDEMLLRGKQVRICKAGLNTVDTTQINRTWVCSPGWGNKRLSGTQSPPCG